MERLDWAFLTVLKVPKAAMDEKRTKHPRRKKQAKRTA
jgi:hypothetical protein